jgi:hypothetical protein
MTGGESCMGQPEQQSLHSRVPFEGAGRVLHAVAAGQEASGSPSGMAASGDDWPAHDHLMMMESRSKSGNKFEIDLVPNV